MKRSLVTGGAGFLGSHLCDALLADGHEVIAIDNLFTSSRDNIAHLKNNPRFDFIEADVIAPFEADVDEIYNLACPCSPVHYQRAPVMTVKTNVMGAINVLELAKRNGARVLLTSTSEVYGDPEVHPQPETYWGNTNPIGPRSCYDEGKRVAETLFFDYHRQFGVDIRVARIFNTYGPRMALDDGRVVSNFIVQALRNEEITLYGDGTQTRSFCYVSDLIQGLRALMATDDVTGPVNLGDPQERSVASLATHIVTAAKSRSKITHRDLPVDDPKRRKPDISLAKSILNWQPKTTFETGIAKTMSHFKSRL